MLLCIQQLHSGLFYLLSQMVLLSVAVVQCNSVDNFLKQVMLNQMVSVLASGLWV